MDFGWRKEILEAARLILRTFLSSVEKLCSGFHEMQNTGGAGFG